MGGGWRNVLGQIVSDCQNGHAPEDLSSRAPSPVIERLLRIDVKAKVLPVVGSCGGELAKRAEGRG